MAIQLAFATKLEKGKRHSPESFSRAMWFSTWAWARIMTIELSGLAFAVCVEAPVAVLEGRKQAALGTGVKRLSPDDEPCPLRQRREQDERGELTDRGTVSLLAVFRERRHPHLLDPFCVEDGGLDLVVGHCAREETDVASPQSGRESRGGAARVGPADDLAFDEDTSSPTWWPAWTSPGS